MTENGLRSLIVIPARGGSKGVPRKNIRPLLGRPLISYAIEAALGVGGDSRVVVTTDDDEIALFAARFGAATISRPADLAGDAVTIDPVVVHATKEAEQKWGAFDVVITVQPTSPLLKTADIVAALELFRDTDADTVISAVDDRHLRWRLENGEYVPDYSQRVNRQQLPPVYRETGAVIACRRNVLETGTRIGARIKLFVMDEDRAVDIDTYRDFSLCELILHRRLVVFNVIGSRPTGLGHAFRAVMLAHEFVHHDVIFMCDSEDDLAIDYIRQHNYTVCVCSGESRLDKILGMKPALVINDILDTSADYIIGLKKAGIKVVNFEDMGLGAEVADLVINALYPHQMPRDHILVGSRYFCLRDEFLHVPECVPRETVERVLVTFGGVDEGNLTSRVIALVGGELDKRGIAIDVVLGPGFAHRDELEETVRRLGVSNVNIVAATTRISDYMAKADIAVTSGGRTVLELAALNVPVIVICQNHRETTHDFASSGHGVVNLGLRHDVCDSDIVATVNKVIDDADLRMVMRKRAAKLNLRDGKKRVMEKINKLLGWEEQL